MFFAWYGLMYHLGDHHIAQAHVNSHNLLISTMATPVLLLPNERPTSKHLRLWSMQGDTVSVMLNPGPHVNILTAAVTVSADLPSENCFEEPLKFFYYQPNLSK